VAFVRRNHLAIAAVLFVIAVLLYVVGLRLEAGAVLVLAVTVESLAWIALLTDRTEGTFPPKVSGGGAKGQDAS
jgi:hypothetical protein